MVARIKKNDSVVVISGRDRGRSGVVIEVMPKKNKALVKDVAVVVKHAKARRQGEVGGIKKKESPVNLSILMPVCKSCGKPCRVNVKDLSEGGRVRICNRCKEVF